MFSLLLHPPIEQKPDSHSLRLSTRCCRSIFPIASSALQLSPHLAAQHSLHVANRTVASKTGITPAHRYQLSSPRPRKKWDFNLAIYFLEIQMTKIFSSHPFLTGRTLLLGREFKWDCEGEEAAAVEHLSFVLQCDYQLHAWLSLPSTCHPLYLQWFLTGFFKSHFKSFLHRQGERAFLPTTREREWGGKAKLAALINRSTDPAAPSRCVIQQDDTGTSPGQLFTACFILFMRSM